jgi:Phagosome assembly factor 1
MPNLPGTHILELKPGESLGPLSLDASLYAVLNTLIAEKAIFPRLNISFDPLSPVASPIFIDLEANGIRLRFDGESQHLQVIEVTDFSKLGIIYNDTNIRFLLHDGVDASRNGPPTFRLVYKTMGPTSPGQLDPATSTAQQTYILSYPGIAFKFPVEASTADSVPSGKSLLNVLHNAVPPCTASNILVFAGASWGSAEIAMRNPRPAEATVKARKMAVEEEEVVSFTEIVPNEKVVVHFVGGGKVELAYGVFGVQDAVTFLGAPDEIFNKSDHRLSIHNGHLSQEDKSPLSEGIHTLYLG